MSSLPGLLDNPDIQVSKRLRTGCAMVMLFRKSRYLIYTHPRIRRHHTVAPCCRNTSARNVFLCQKLSRNGCNRCCHKSKHFQVYRDNSESHVGLLTLSDYHRWSHAGETLTQHVVCELDVRNTTPEPVRILDGTREPTSTKHGEAPNLPNLHAAEEDWQDLGPCNLLESYRSLMPAIWSSSC